MKNFKFYLLFLVAAAFLIPGFALAELTVKIDRVSPSPADIGKPIYVTATATWTLSGDAIKYSGNLELEVDFHDDQETLLGDNEKIKDPEINNLSFTHTFPGHAIYGVGSRQITVTAKGSAWGKQEEATATATVEIKDTPPTIKSLEALSTAEEYNDVPIKIKATDDLWVYGIYINFGDGMDNSCHPDKQSSAGEDIWLCQFTHQYSLPEDLAEGVDYKTYTIEVYAKDSAGFLSQTPIHESAKVTHDIKIYRTGKQPPGEDGGDNDGDNNINIGPITIDNPLTSSTFSEFIDKLISFVFTLALILFPILLIVAGIMFLTAGGDPAKVQQARKLLIYAVIGFAIIALAKLFVALIQQVFGIKEGG